LDRYRSEVKSSNVYAPFFTMLPHHCLENMRDILPVLLAVHNNVTVSRSSDLGLEQVKNNNIIYVGKFRNLRILDNLIQNLQIKYTWAPNKIFIINANKDTVKSFKRIRSATGKDLVETNWYNEDYALVVKLPGPNRNAIWIFAGFGHISLIETVKHFTHPLLLKQIESELEEEHGHIPQYFESLFKVSGYKRTGFNTEMQFSHELGRDFKFGL